MQFISKLLLIRICLGMLMYDIYIYCLRKIILFRVGNKIRIGSDWYLKKTLRLLMQCFIHCCIFFLFLILTSSNNKFCLFLLIINITVVIHCIILDHYDCLIHQCIQLHFWLIINKYHFLNLNKTKLIQWYVYIYCLSFDF